MFVIIVTLQVIFICKIMVSQVQFLIQFVFCAQTLQIYGLIAMSVKLAPSTAAPFVLIEDGESKTNGTYCYCMCTPRNILCGGDGQTNFDDVKKGE